MLLLIMSIGKHRYVNIVNNKIYKRYDINSTPSNRFWTGMTERDAFFHEARVLLHIEQMKSQCNYSHQIGRLLDIDVNTHTIVTEKLGKPIVYFNKSKFFYEIVHIRNFFDCVGVTHCDTKPKNFGRVNKSMYIFDMDISYITVTQKPPKMSCQCTLHKPCFW